MAIRRSIFRRGGGEASLLAHDLRACREGKTAAHPASNAGQAFPDHASMLDLVQAPSLRHAPELVKAAIPEADLRLRHQLLDRARDQHFAGTRLGGDTRADVEGKTDH